jgi:hypothetical protein
MVGPPRRRTRAKRNIGVEEAQGPRIKSVGAEFGRRSRSGRLTLPGVGFARFLRPATRDIFGPRSRLLPPPSLTSPATDGRPLGDQREQQERHALSTRVEGHDKCTSEENLFAKDS